ncbi:gamma-glutamyltransferase family protein [Brevibacterium zhoupengii]|uniref:gamma-glutamyltransferase family protein n=1 Tax=Brevibacterium zhoupengii TaxID=2898795 RepID=UPI001E55A5A1|nr:gamma-glutamyltransferase [Brevibacterium zhoupengii]
MIMAEGGNAVDAVVAAALVQTVVDPLMCGLGGMAVAQVMTRESEIVVIDALGQTPSQIRPDIWLSDYLGPTPDGFGYQVRGHRNETGAESVMVPGTLKALANLHSRFGSTPWADLFADAIRIAKSGWTVRPYVQATLDNDEAKNGRMNYADKLLSTPDGRRIYGAADRPPRVGDVITNPELSEVLRHIAEHGSEELYKGAIADLLASSVQRDGGLLCIDDLRHYTIHELRPLLGKYRGIGLSMPPQPAGGIQTMQILGILNEFELSGLGHNSSAHIEVLSEAMKRALQDKESLWQKSDVSEDDYLSLLSSERAKTAAEAIRNSERVQVGRVHEDSPNTTHVCAIDEQGFTVSLTHTLGNPSGYIPTGLGFMLNGGMSTFDPRPGSVNSVQAGRRRNTTACPVIVFDESGPILTLGAPGGSLITPAIVQALSNFIDFGMDVREAVLAPRIAATSNAIDLSNRISRESEAALVKRSYEVRRSPMNYAFGAVHALSKLNGSLEGAADPQRDGHAAAVF